MKMTDFGALVGTPTSDPAKGEHPLDGCLCNCYRWQHSGPGGRCVGLDSYEAPCACPGFEAGDNA